MRLIIACAIMMAAVKVCRAQSTVSLPPDVNAVWDMSQADPSRTQDETTPTRERICINGLWRWQPSRSEVTSPIRNGAKKIDAPIPTGGWGYFKVPGPWPGITSYMQKDSQMVYRHPDWENADPDFIGIQSNLRNISTAWYQREITIPDEWSGRRIALSMEYLNSHAIVYVDDAKVGEILFPSGEVDITSVCRPGETYVLSLYVTAMPLGAVIASYNNTGTAELIKGNVERRGLCGDVFLTSTPAGARISDVKVDTSVHRWEIRFDTAVQNLNPGEAYYTELIRGERQDNPIDVLNGLRVIQLTEAAWKSAEGGRLVKVEIS
ncbi:hypothetical protein HYR99_42090 [Candidatus Poribacteria bacterium]|nr:hypothetical protein [Candidatus Poribacteria bacterium]